MPKKNVNLSVGRGEKKSVSQGAGLTEKGRKCEWCGINIDHKRKDARFCTRKHKSQLSDSKRDTKASYQKHRESAKKRALEYYYKNHEEAKKKQLERQKIRLPKIAAYEANRRALKMQRTPAWLTKIDKERISNEYKLAALQSKITGEPWHVDHIIPLQGEFVSGLHVPSNLVAMRGIENISKNNRYKVA